MARHPRHNPIMEDVTARIVRGDCATALRDCTDNYFDLIVTSPPYADQRKTTYGGIKAEHYNQWFLEKNCNPGKWPNRFRDAWRSPSGAVPMR